MKQYVLNGQNMLTREAAHDEIALALEMPAHYGRNLDALWDELSCLQGEIILVHADSLAAMGEYGEKLLETFREAEEANSSLRLIIQA